MTKTVAIIGTRGYPSYYGGFETLIRNLAPYLADQGWDVAVYGRPGSVVPGDAERDPRVESIITRGVESKSLSTVSFGLTATMHACRRGPDAALVMNVANGFWLPMLARRGIPSVVNVDGMEWERDKWGRAARFVFRSGAKLTARYGERLVVDSAEIGRRWRAEFHRTGEFIPYGGTVPDAGAVDLDVQVNRPYALMVARFVPENSVREFFEAAEILSRRWDVVIVGSSGYGGEFDASARRLSEGSDRIHWLGQVSDDRLLFGLWRNAGAYFHGHSVGGTNPALVQAMACGAPTVARDTVYNHEVLHDAAVYVEPDGRAIAAAIDGVLSDPALQRHLGSAAFTRQQREYTWEQVCEKYACLLREVTR